MNDFNDSPKYIAYARMLTSEVQGDNIVLHLDQGQYYGLNRVAAHVWELLQKGATIEELVNSTTERFEVAAQDCERDLRQLLSELMQYQLITVETVPAEEITQGQ
jgi:hypothetical protein